jgi:hypothetical protein
MAMTETDVKERLKQMSVELSENDDEAILFAVERTEEHIKNVCNIDYVPEELELLAVDMACGEFLQARLVADMLLSFDAKGALKAVTEGDVKLEYGGSDSNEVLLKYLSRGENELYRFRRLCW